MRQFSRWMVLGGCLWLSGCGPQGCGGSSGGGSAPPPPPAAFAPPPPPSPEASTGSSPATTAAPSDGLPQTDTPSER